MKEYWDQRYSEEGFAYGREPNQFFRETLDTLKPGGTLILECFHKEQLKFETGGPKVPEMLYNKEILMKDFNSPEISNNAIRYEITENNLCACRHSEG